jgi:hypothetical protein
MMALPALVVPAVLEALVALADPALQVVLGARAALEVLADPAAR